MPPPVLGFRNAAPPPGGTVLAIGNFDGVHLGHRAILRSLVELAAELGASPWIYTFDPAPTAVVAPSRHQPRISTLATRVRRLVEGGAAQVVVEAFTPAFAAVPAEAFARTILGDALHVRGLVVGHDFRFGSGRGGDGAALAGWLPGVVVREVGAVQVNGHPVSSSRVRKKLAIGDVEAVTRLLGAPTVLTGEVVRGFARGRTIGFPTANVAAEEELIPAHGVYAVRVELDGALLPGVCNIGVRPTFDGEKVSVEVHLLDFAGDLYGRRLEVQLIARLREERRFSGLDALVAQIAADAAEARARLA